MDLSLAGVVMYGIESPTSPSEPAPEPNPCPVCEVRAIYHHGFCKACHDTRWYTSRCPDCARDGNYPPHARPARRPVRMPIPPVDLNEGNQGRPRVANPVKPYRPRNRRVPDTRTRRQRAEDNGHPDQCRCGFCDPTQPLVLVKGGK